MLAYFYEANTRACVTPMHTQAHTQAHIDAHTDAHTGTHGHTQAHRCTNRCTHRRAPVNTSSLRWVCKWESTPRAALL